MPRKLTADQAIGLAKTLSTGQPNRFKVMRGTSQRARVARCAGQAVLGT